MGSTSIHRSFIDCWSLHGEIYGIRAMWERWPVRRLDRAPLRWGCQVHLAQTIDVLHRLWSVTLGIG